VLAQLVQDLVHLERREHGLDQDGGLDRAGLEPKRLFREVKDLVPKARFETALELRNVEPGPLGVVEDIQAEVEERAGDRLALDVNVPLGQMPAPRAHDQDGRVLHELVVLLAGVVGDRSRACVAQIDLALDVIRPGRRVCVLEVGHEDPGARVERVDDHLPVHWARDLDPAVAQVVRRRRNGPVRLADLARLREEVRALAGVEALLALLARGQQAPPLGIEAPMQLGDECERTRRQDLELVAPQRAEDLGAVTRFRGPAHRDPGTCRAPAPTSGTTLSWASLRLSSAA
jgi:hypothetical protein